MACASTTLLSAERCAGITRSFPATAAAYCAVAELGKGLIAALDPDAIVAAALAAARAKGITRSEARNSTHL
ncbi:hypothetical protein [Thiocapsa sp.]|uniref:hypothetical protein n=1 Tax=Thiocapsa sp. TaxID=2024551 RepID=UPI0025D77FB4|nr:hypothetical protein [Thiocapsa sp.]